MYPYLMKISILNIAFLFLFCIRLTGQEIPRDDHSLPWKPLFPAEFQKGLFRMTMDVKKHHMTGLLLIKEVKDSSIRIIFTNEIGMQFFDFEFREGIFSVKYIFPQMDKKMLISALEKDFRLMLVPGIMKRIKPVPSDSSGYKKYKVSLKMGSYFYTAVESSSRIKAIRSSGSLFDRVSLSVSGPDAAVPRKMSIRNSTTGLIFRMTYLGD
jgi:hypothetical protein